MLKRNGYLQPAILQALGIAMIIAAFVIWTITGHESALLIGAALTLIGVGSGAGAIITVREQISKYHGPEDDEDDEE